MAQLFNHVRDAVIMLDATGTVGFWSQGAATIYGRQAPEALNRSYLSILPPNCRTSQTPLIHRALEGDELSAEWRTTSPIGSPMWLEGDFRPVVNNNGERIGCAILLHDVSKWRAADEARRLSEARLRTITDSIPGAVFQLRVSAKGEQSLPFISRGVAAQFERTAAELAAQFQNADELAIPADRSVLRESLDRAQQSSSTWDVEFRVETARTGQIKWLSLHAVPTRLPDGDTEWNGFLSDVTDKVAATQALRENETRYRLLTENAKDLISRFDPNGMLLYASPAAQWLFGLAPEDCVGCHLRDFLHEDDAPKVLDFFDGLIAGNSTGSITHRWRSISGGFAWCESTAGAVANREGRVAEVVTVTRSIDERRKLEARVQHSHKMEAVGRLAGGVAHDFNNLLTVINGFSEIILRSLSNPDVGRIRSQVEEIHKAGERASALTRQLLAFGRQQVQTRTRVNLNQVIEETRKLLRRVLGEDIEIDADLATEPMLVLADVGQIEQVIMNLVLNARDAMPDGGTLTLRTGSARFDDSPDGEARPGDYVLLEVGDTGVGMDEATRARAFEPFFTTRELGKGSGLGLATVYGIVKQSGGYIEIDSEPGRGATFRVFLPRYDSTGNGERRAIHPTLPLGRETILLVEDDDAVRGVTSSMLRTLGYRVVEADGGLNALRQCREFGGPIHLLLTDVVMPLMNGREVADRVQALLPGIRTLFMSGYTDDSILRHGVLDDGVAFLSKPLNHETLGRKVREVLGSSA